MLDIVSNGDNLQEKSNLYVWKEYENVSLCSVFYVFLCIRHRAKLRREVTPSLKTVKTYIKSLLIQNILPNLNTLSVYILFNSVYV